MQTCMETTHGKQAINKRTLMQSYTEINKSFQKLDLIGYKNGDNYVALDKTTKFSCQEMA